MTDDPETGYDHLDDGPLDPPYSCACGATSRDMATWDDGQEYSAHYESDSHFRRLYEQMDADLWAELLEDVDNGLGWADNEGMGRGDRKETMEMLRRLIAEHLGGSHTYTPED